jgi:hypothetical protein
LAAAASDEKDRLAYGSTIALDEGADVLYIGVNIGGRLTALSGPTEWRVLKYRASDGVLLRNKPVVPPERRIQVITHAGLDSKGRLYLTGYTAIVVDGEEHDYPGKGRFWVARFDSECHQLGLYSHRDFLYYERLQVQGSSLYASGYQMGIIRLLKMQGVATRAEGDLTGDGCVDDLDLAQVIFALGSSDPGSDVNADGLVNREDLRQVIGNFGLGCEE